MDSCLGILSEFQISMQRFFSLVVRVRQKTGGAHRGVTKHVTSGRSIENLEFVVLSSSLRRFGLTCLCCGVVPALAASSLFSSFSATVFYGYWVTVKSFGNAYQEKAERTNASVLFSSTTFIYKGAPFNRWKAILLSWIRIFLED